MRAAWTINSIPAYFISNRKSPPLTQTIRTKFPEDYVASEFSVKHIIPQTKDTSYFNNKSNLNHPLPTVSLFRIC